jgi:hypothetical protein
LSVPIYLFLSSIPLAKSHCGTINNSEEKEKFLKNVKENAAGKTLTKISTKYSFFKCCFWTGSA